MDHPERKSVESNVATAMTPMIGGAVVNISERFVKLKLDVRKSPADRGYFDIVALSPDEAEPPLRYLLEGEGIGELRNIEERYQTWPRLPAHKNFMTQTEYAEGEFDNLGGLFSREEFRTAIKTVQEEFDNKVHAIFDWMTTIEVTQTIREHGKRVLGSLKGERLFLDNMFQALAGQFTDLQRLVGASGGF